MTDDDVPRHAGTYGGASLLADYLECSLWHSALQWGDRYSGAWRLAGIMWLTARRSLAWGGAFVPLLRSLAGERHWGSERRHAAYGSGVNGFIDHVWGYVCFHVNATELFMLT